MYSITLYWQPHQQSKDYKILCIIHGLNKACKHNTIHKADIIDTCCCTFFMLTFPSIFLAECTISNSLDYESRNWSSLYLLRYPSQPCSHTFWIFTSIHFLSLLLNYLYIIVLVTYITFKRSSYMKETTTIRWNCAHNFANGEVEKGREKLEEWTCVVNFQSKKMIKK